MLIAQISDLHLRSCGSLLHGTIDTERALDACIEHLLALAPAPDLVLGTGDLTDFGRPEDYARLRHALDRLPMPVYLIPGNHDHRQTLRNAFADRGYLPATGEFLHYTVENWPLRLIGLDTMLPGRVEGGLCEERLAWLGSRLAEQPSRPTLIFMHHPPFATGIGFMDLIPFAGAEALAVLLRAHPAVRQIACGHVHRAIHRNWAGTAAAIAPSTVYQMNLALDPAEGFTYIEQPPAIALYLWREGGGGDADPVSFISLIGYRENANSRGPTNAFTANASTADADRLT